MEPYGRAVTFEYTGIRGMLMSTSESVDRRPSRAEAMYDEWKAPATGSAITITAPYLGLVALSTTHLQSVLCPERTRPLGNMWLAIPILTCPERAHSEMAS
mmetsp:Transcript_21078/g.41766  ORF Transcript_21078/g.41766 Transcript_21078/m.41766 type:complete len:101 (+) Transcript_21078:275-577(+)